MEGLGTKTPTTKSGRFTWRLNPVRRHTDSNSGPKNEGMRGIPNGGLPRDTNLAVQIATQEGVNYYTPITSQESIDRCTRSRCIIRSLPRVAAASGDHPVPQASPVAPAPSAYTRGSAAGLHDEVTQSTTLRMMRSSAWSFLLGPVQLLGQRTRWVARQDAS